METIHLTLKSRHSADLKPSSNLELKIPPLFRKEFRKPINAKAWKALLRESLFKSMFKNYNKAFKKHQHLGQPVSFRFKVDLLSRSPELTLVEVVEKPASEQAPALRENSDVGLQHALAAARERGRHRVAEILGSKDMLSAEEFASMLNTNRMTINTKRRKYQLLALEGATRGFRYPQWQIGPDGKPFKALPKLFERLGNDAWTVYRFLIQHHPELDGLTGREALRRGMTSETIDAAESVARNTA